MNYEAYFDELNVISQNAVATYNEATSYSNEDGEIVQREDNTQELEDLLDFIEDCLYDAVAVGVLDADEELLASYEIDAILTGNDINELIYEEVGGKTWVERVREYLQDDPYLSDTKIKRLVETEVHRVVNDVKYKVAKYHSTTTDTTVRKLWETMKDSKVRDTHVFLEGIIVDLDESFVTIGGDSAMYPGGFTDAENNINCRCVVKLIS